MKINVSYDYNKVFKTLLSEKLDTLGLDYEITTNNEVVFEKSLSKQNIEDINIIFKRYGITFSANHNLAIVDRIKSAINDMLLSDDFRLYNTSDYLSEKLNYSYTYLSALFTESTYSSIESFIILCKVDRAKTLLLNTNLTLTEIAFQLNYSSVAHLSRQFKKTTGLTPSDFKKIIEKRKSLV